MPRSFPSHKGTLLIYNTLPVKPDSPGEEIKLSIVIYSGTSPPPLPAATDKKTSAGHTSKKRRFYFFFRLLIVALFMADPALRKRPGFNPSNAGRILIV